MVDIILCISELEHCLIKKESKWMPFSFRYDEDENKFFIDCVYSDMRGEKQLCTVETVCRIPEDIKEVKEILKKSINFHNSKLIKDIEDIKINSELWKLY